MVSLLPEQTCRESARCYNLSAAPRGLRRFFVSALSLRMHAASSVARDAGGVPAAPCTVLRLKQSRASSSSWQYCSRLTGAGLGGGGRGFAANSRLAGDRTRRTASLAGDGPPVGPAGCQMRERTSWWRTTAQPCPSSRLPMSNRPVCSPIRKGEARVRPLAPVLWRLGHRRRRELATGAVRRRNR